MLAPPITRMHWTFLAPELSATSSIERESPLALSNVLVVCGRCDKPVRSGTKVLADGRKLRVCKRCGEPIDKG